MINFGYLSSYVTKKRYVLDSVSYVLDLKALDSFINISLDTNLEI